MALVVADRVQETTTTTGTGTVTLAGASAGYQSFAAIGDGNTTYYTLTSGNNWEVGVGTYTASGTTLARTTVLASSAGGTTKITLSGTSNVFVTYPAEIATMIGTPSTVGTSGGYQFLQSAGAASPTWVQINSFKDVATAPTSPTPIEGDRFFDNTTGIDYTRITDADGSQWVETSATGGASNVYTKTTFAATAGQTTFSVTYTVGYVDVYLNGVKLTTSEYTASSGTSVVLGTAAALNDVVETIAWTVWSATNTAIGAGTGTSLALNGATLGSNALAVAGTAAISGATTLGVASTTQGSLVLANTSANSTTVKSSNSASAAYTITLPTTAGTSGQFLQTNGSGVTSWAAAGGGPQFAAVNNADQTGLVSDTYTKVTFQTEIYDTDNNFASSRFTPTTAGYYAFQGRVTQSGTGILRSGMAFYKNGAVYAKSYNEDSAGYAQAFSQFCDVIYCNGSTDYVEVFGYGLFTTGKYDGTSNFLCTFSGQWLHT